MAHVRVQRFLRTRKSKNGKKNAHGCGFGGESAYTHRLSRSAWEKLIDEWIFSERDRRILKRRLLKESWRGARNHCRGTYR